MQLNRQTDYALRVLIFLTLKSHDDLVKLDEISKKFNIVRNHLTKIIAKLAKLQYIITQRGNGGGIKVHPNALELNLFEIMSKFESSFKSIDCTGINCPIAGMCKLEAILAEASGAYTSVLQKYKLKDVLPSNNNEQRIIFKSLDLI
ncbi:RrF2 family transcriptional regulator [Francisella adeliensis]|uniref:Rrf2 family transcriptional regulator n=1 Tax=Francisella adeliensis TaxID=2007306 RepID=A0A2Z4XWQ3_9GAMM|nr:Rrf2 family transcriptional regulator [Francisella adeliensis]AXA33307.1 hypothetical protein CDH04_02250 [Francisella adeliensis]MBK2084963.1 Rrf2 family transcriptional regulator [Francisella adeliensis]MBK2097045.1 Rrf2 family transcriptional regulator [Francisella adeliensis]QIW11537.1 Rrf2 family transcriptional regulator [Francisella adeliensis]QIW13411.1 Rrf2 family transcriptional regulator [Francisella adeliensis]